MPSSLYQLVIDAHEPRRVAEFWAAVLDWTVLYADDYEVMVGQSPDSYPGLCIVPATDSKVIKNRLHIDLAPDDRDAEVERILALGATRIDIGQGDATWVVLADPEGNEFCVLAPKNSLVG